jgi:hypothetical protein
MHRNDIIGETSLELDVDVYGAAPVRKLTEGWRPQRVPSQLLQHGCALHSIL